MCFGEKVQVSLGDRRIGRNDAAALRHVGALLYDLLSALPISGPTGPSQDAGMRRVKKSTRRVAAGGSRLLRQITT